MPRFGRAVISIGTGIADDLERAEFERISEQAGVRNGARNAGPRAFQSGKSLPANPLLEVIALDDLLFLDAGVLGELEIIRATHVAGRHVDRVQRLEESRGVNGLAEGVMQHFVHPGIEASRAADAPRRIGNDAIAFLQRRHVGRFGGACLTPQDQRAHVAAFYHGPGVAVVGLPFNAAIAARCKCARLGLA